MGDIASFANAGGDNLALAVEKKINGLLKCVVDLDCLHRGCFLGDDGAHAFLDIQWKVPIAG